jgi:hypothetical protein
VDNQLNPATGTIRARGFSNTDKLMSPILLRVRIPARRYDAAHPRQRH